MAAEIATAYVSLIPSMRGAGKAIAKEIDGPDVRKAADSAGKGVGDRLSKGVIAGAAAAGTLAANAISSAIGSVGDFASEIVAASDATNKFQQTMQFAGFEPKGIEKATKAAQDYADATVYELSDIQSTMASLASNGIKNYSELTNAAGNLNAVAGGNVDTFKSVTMMLSQTAGAGKLSTENWNQLADAIPGASGPLQKALKDAGAYTGNFRDAMAKGQITADEFNAALLKLGSDPVAVEAATSTTTFEGALGNLKATITGALLPAFDAIKPAITNALSGVANFIPRVVDGVKALMGFLSTGDFTTAFREAFNVEEDSGLVAFLTNVRNIGLEAAGGFRAMVAAFQAGGSDVTSSGFAGMMERLGLAARAVFDYMRNTAIPALIDLGGWLVRNKDWVILVASAVGGAVIAYRTYVAVTKAWTIATQVATVAQRALNLVMRANPIGIVITAIGALVGAIVYLYNNNETARRIINAVWTAIKTAISAVVTWFTQTAWPWMKTAIENIGTWFGKARDWVVNAWNAIRNGLSAGWNWINTNVFDPLKRGVDAIGKAFNATKDFIGRAWDGIKAAAAKPVNFVIETVYTNGIKATWDKIASAVGLTSLKLPTVNPIKFASGGVLPGYTPGRDVHEFYSPTGGRLSLSGGEAIMRPEFTRAVGGPAGVARLNSMARKGQAFKDGGVWGWAGDAWDFVKDKAASVGKFLTDPVKALGDLIKKPVQSLLSGVGGGTLGQMVSALPTKVVGGLIDKVKGLVAGGGGAGGPMGSGSVRGIAAMTAAVKALDPTARITSGYRPGAMTATGVPSFHGQGRAIDIVSANMGKTWDLLRSRYGKTAAELFYTPKGFLRRGVMGSAAPITRKTHYSHVHWAMANGGVLPKLYDQGGWIPHGGMGLNLSGKPEAVLTPDESKALKNGSLGRQTNLTFNTQRVTPRDVIYALDLADLHDTGV